MPWFEEIAPGQAFNDYVMARNPLVDAFRKANPAIAAIAAREAPAPTLFADGDLPPFTASGIDPQLLLRVAWPARHAIAAAPRETAFALMQDYMGEPDMAAMDFGGHPGNVEYAQRVFAWASGRLQPPPDTSTEFTVQRLKDIGLEPAPVAAAAPTPPKTVAAPVTLQGRLLAEAVATGKITDADVPAWAKRLGNLDNPEAGPAITELSHMPRGVHNNAPVAQLLREQACSAGLDVTKIKTVSAADLTAPDDRAYDALFGSGG